MNRRDGRLGFVAGAVACAACCTGPILGVLAAIGITSAFGAALFGVGVLLLGGVAAALVLARRRRVPSCAAPPEDPAPITVALDPVRRSRT